MEDIPTVDELVQRIVNEAAIVTQENAARFDSNILDHNHLSDRRFGS